MKTLKSIAVALLIIGMMVMPAFGYVNHSGLSEGPTQTPADIETIFGVDNLKGLEVAELSQKEMMETKGASWLNLISAGWGGVSGGVFYTTSAWASGGEWRLGPFAYSVGGGAVAGLFFNPVAGATIGSGWGSVITGVGKREEPITLPRFTPQVSTNHCHPRLSQDQGIINFHNGNSSGIIVVMPF